MKALILALSLATITSTALANPAESHRPVRNVLSWWSMPKCSATATPKVACSEKKDFGYVCTNYWASVGVTAMWHWVRIDSSELATRCP